LAMRRVLLCLVAVVRIDRGILAGRSRRLGALSLLGAGLVACASAPAAGALVGPFGHAGRWITDSGGRVVVLHGLNEVYKVPPYYPGLPAFGFGDDDAAFLAANGFDAVRVGVIWKAVEPQPGRYDQGYLEQIVATVDTLARHGIVSLLDFHQDQFSERFGGEGAPDWAVLDDGQPNGPGGYVGNQALQRSFDHFWNNDPGPDGVGLQDRFAAAWAHVAARFRSDPAVLGYELINEPWPGTAWQPCAQPAGCPTFDAKLTAFTRRVDAVIRTVDSRTLVFYEPNVLFTFGNDTQLGPIGDPRAAFAFHDYCLIHAQSGSNAGCDAPDDLVFANALKRAAATGDAVLETEFGSTDDAGNLNAMVARADRNMVGWLEWAYSGDSITSSPGGYTQSLVIDPSKPPTGPNVKEAKLAILARPYPQVVAGTPESWSFDPASSMFKLHYRTRKPGGGRFPRYAETDIAAPAVEYPGGYSVRLKGGVALSAPGRELLRVLACPGARSVTVTVKPSGPSHNGCKAPRRVFPQNARK